MENSKAITKARIRIAEDLFAFYDGESFVIASGKYEDPEILIYLSSEELFRLDTFREWVAKMMIDSTLFIEH